MRPSIIDARFNDESASESIAEQRRAAVNTHLIRDAIFHDDFRALFQVESLLCPRFFTSTADISIAVTRHRAFYTRRVSNSPLSQRLIPMKYRGPAVLIVAIRRCSKKQYGYIHGGIFTPTFLSNKCLQNLHAKVSVSSTFRLARAILT